MNLEFFFQNQQNGNFVRYLFLVTRLFFCRRRSLVYFSIKLLNNRERKLMITIMNDYKLKKDILLIVYSIRVIK